MRLAIIVLLGIVSSTTACPSVCILALCSAGKCHSPRPCSSVALAAKCYLACPLLHASKDSQECSKLLVSAATTLADSLASHSVTPSCCGQPAALSVTLPPSNLNLLLAATCTPADGQPVSAACKLAGDAEKHMLHLGL